MRTVCLGQGYSFHLIVSGGVRRLVCNLYSTQRPPSGCRSSGTDRHLLLPDRHLTQTFTVFPRVKWGLGRIPSQSVHTLSCSWDQHPWRRNMLYWALVFLVIALIAGVLGFTGVAIAAAGVAKILFVVFLILFLISLVTHLARGATR